MTLEEVMKKSRIEFPRPISLDKAELLLDCLCEKLPAHIQYSVSYHKSIGYDDKEKISKEPETVNITASIISVRSLDELHIVFDLCEFEHSAKDSSKLSAIQFQMIPGYNLSEYRAGVISLWDNTRAIVAEYFKKESA